MNGVELPYSVGGKSFIGYLAYPEAPAGSAPRPGVLVCHDAAGLGEHAKTRARRLAELGYVAYALDIFTRQPYLRMSTRGVPEAPGRSVSGQRALESATTLVVNQHSLSDAEDFTEGYRTLKLGPVVGEPTAGWIIYTWDVRLVDGSTLRLPRMRVKAADGSDMEMSPRKVDVAATRPLGESAAGKDTQLDEAIKALLKKLGRAE